MENELRYYLKLIKEEKDFVPTYIITAVELPTGAIELAINTTNIQEKIDCILESYDEDMVLKTNSEVRMKNLMVV